MRRLTVIIVAILLAIFALPVVAEAEEGSEGSCISTTEHQVTRHGRVKRHRRKRRHARRHHRRAKRKHTQSTSAPAR